MLQTSGTAPKILISVSQEQSEAPEAKSKVADYPKRLRTASIDAVFAHSLGVVIQSLAGDYGLVVTLYDKSDPFGIEDGRPHRNSAFGTENHCSDAPPGPTPEPSQ